MNKILIMLFTFLKKIRKNKIYTTNFYKVEKNLSLGQPSKKIINSLINSNIKFLDIGAKGGVFKYLDKYKDLLDIYVCEPNPKEADILQEMGYNVIRHGIAGQSGVRVLNITRDSGSSSVLNPKTKWRSFVLKNSNNEKKIDVLEKLQIDCLGINQIKGLNDLDFLKLDVQGLEFEILKNMESFSPLFIITEVSFMPFYEGQGTFSDIDIALREKGYVCISLDSRKVIYDKLTKFDYFSSPGTIRHCDAWFIPSWLDEVGLEIICKNDLKFAALLFIHGFQDLIVQIFQNIDSPNNKFILEKMLVENY